MPAAVREAEVRMNATREKLASVLLDYLPSSLAHTVLESSAGRAQLDLTNIQVEDVNRLAHEMRRSLRLFVSPAGRMEDCMRRLRAIGGAHVSENDGTVVVAVETEEDIVVARNMARDTCHELGFPLAIPTKVATVVSELARNIFQYAGKGLVEIRQLSDGKGGIEVVATDQGPGISDLDAILEGKYRSRRGMGMGLIATKRLMDHFHVKTSAGSGTTVTIRKYRT